ncbi:unnamed protein product, partial [Prorocentrum cordatum]
SRPPGARAPPKRAGPPKPGHGAAPAPPARRPRSRCREAREAAVGRGVGMLLDRADAEPLLGIGAEDGLAVGARAARSPRLALGAPLAPLRGWRCALGGGAAAAAGLRGSLLRSDDVLTDDED